MPQPAGKRGRMDEHRAHTPTNPSTENARAAGDTPTNPFHTAVFHAGSFEDQPIWASLYESFHDTLFPPKLPPLELTSTPVPTPDRMAVRSNPWAIGTATIA